MIKKRKQARQYNSTKSTYDGHEFDSNTELLFYRYLKRQANVLKIELQPVYQIIDRYTVTCKRCEGTGKRISDKTGNPINCKLCSGKGEREKPGAVYTADFKVTYDSGLVEIIDVKGWKAERDFSLRKKLIEIQTGMELIVVRLIKGEWVRE